MANEQNLEKGVATQFQAGEEQVKIAQKGGLASAESRRKKRDLRLALEMLLEKDFKDKSGNTISGTEAVTAKLFEKAMKGDVRAFETLRDTVGQKPVEKLEVAKIEKEQSVLELQELFEDDE